MIIRSVWSNGWVFVSELSGSGFESSCSHLTFRFHACFEQGVPWHWGNYSVWIHSETHTWHDKNTEWAFGIDDFFDGPGSELLWSIFICLRGDLLRGCLLPFCFFIVNCTSFVGILLNPLLPKKRIQEFFLYLFQFADKCFGSNDRTWNSVIYMRFTWKIEIYWSKCWNDIIICGNCQEKLQVHYEWQIMRYLLYSMFWE